MNAEFERLEQDFQRESKMLGLSDASVAEIVSASRPSDRLEALLQRWRVLDGKTAGSRLTMMDRVLAVAFPHRLRKRAAKAEAAVFAAMGAAAAGLIPERDRHLSFPGVAQAVSDFITLRRTHERLAELTRELGGYPGRLALEEQILGAQDAYRETSRALLGESYLARLSQSQHGLLRNVIHQLTERRSGQVAPPPGEVSRVLSGLPLWTSTLKSLRSTFPLYCGMFDYVVFDSVVIGAFVGISLALAQLFQLERPYWVPVSCLAVIQGASLRAVWNRQLHRVLGTGIGLLVSWALFLLPLNNWTISLTMMALSFVIEVAVVRHYGFAAIFITPLTILLAEAATLGSTAPTALIVARFHDTVLGSFVGLIGGACLHNMRFREVVGRPLRRLVPARRKDFT